MARPNFLLKFIERSSGGATPVSLFQQTGNEPSSDIAGSSKHKQGLFAIRDHGLINGRLRWKVQRKLKLVLLLIGRKRMPPADSRKFVASVSALRGSDRPITARKRPCL